LIPILITDYIVNKDASRRLDFLDSMYRDGGEYIPPEFISSYFYNIFFIAYIKLVDIQ